MIWTEQTYSPTSDWSEVINDLPAFDAKIAFDADVPFDYDEQINTIWDDVPNITSQWT